MSRPRGVARAWHHWADVCTHNLNTVRNRPKGQYVHDPDAGRTARSSCSTLRVRVSFSWPHSVSRLRLQTSTVCRGQTSFVRRRIDLVGDEGNKMQAIEWSRTSLLQRDPDQKEATYAVANGPCWYGNSPAGTFVVLCHDGQTPVGEYRTGRTYAAIVHGSDGIARVLGDRVSAHRAVELCRTENKQLQTPQASW